MLKTKVVGRYTASQAGSLENVRLRLFFEKIAPLKKQAAKGEALSEDDEAYNNWLGEWATVAACVTPMLTLDEYKSMPFTELRPIIEAVEEVNADEIAANSEPLTPAQAKKKRSAKT